MRTACDGGGDGKPDGDIEVSTAKNKRVYFAQKRSKAYPFHLAISAVKRIPEFTRRNIGQFLRLSKSMFMSE